MVIMSSPIAHNTESYYLDQNIAPARHPESVKNLYKKTTNFVNVENSVAYVKKSFVITKPKVSTTANQQVKTNDRLKRGKTQVTKS